MLSILQPGRTGIKTLKIFGFGTYSRMYSDKKNKVELEAVTTFLQSHHLIFTTVKQYGEVQS